MTGGSTPILDTPRRVPSDSPSRDKEYLQEAKAKRAIDALTNLVRWTVKSRIPLVVEGPGLIDCHLDRQSDRLIIHLVNLTRAGTWRQSVHELIQVGPLQLRLQPPLKAQNRQARLLVAGKSVKVISEADSAQLVIESSHDHEVVVLD